MLQSGQIFIGKIPSNQLYDLPPVAVSAGYVGCIEQVSYYKYTRLIPYAVCFKGFNFAFGHMPLPVADPDRFP